MSDSNTTYTPPTECVVPEGQHLVDGLSVRELDIVSRQLGCDVSAALADKGTGAGKLWAALPRLAWVWTKRRDPHAKLDPFLDLTAAQLGTLLGDDDPAGDQVDDDPDANPTDPAPAS
jgi:hypothetical protein